MELHTIIQKLIEETQISTKSYLNDESPSDVSNPTPDSRPDPGPPRPPPPRPSDPIDCSQWYIWGAIVVVLLAVITLVVILFYFCRRSKDRRPSLETIITNIELQNASQDEHGFTTSVVPTIVPNRNFHDLRIGDNPTRITIIQKY